MWASSRLLSKKGPFFEEESKIKRGSILGVNKMVMVEVCLCAN